MQPRLSSFRSGSPRASSGLPGDLVVAKLAGGWVAARLVARRPVIDGSPRAVTLKTLEGHDPSAERALVLAAGVAAFAKEGLVGAAQDEALMLILRPLKAHRRMAPRAVGPKAERGMARPGGGHIVTLVTGEAILRRTRIDANPVAVAASRELVRAA